jgi:hypothetical protein
MLSGRFSQSGNSVKDDGSIDFIRPVRIAPISS